MTRGDVHIIADVLIGILIGGALVRGLTDTDLARTRARVEALEHRVEILTLQLKDKPEPLPP